MPNFHGNGAQAFPKFARNSTPPAGCVAPPTVATMGSSMSSSKGPSYYDLVQHGFELLKHSIIRPPRHMYNLDDLGPEAFNFGGLAVKRTDLALVNSLIAAMTKQFDDVWETQHILVRCNRVQRLYRAEQFATLPSLSAAHVRPK